MKKFFEGRKRAFDKGDYYEVLEFDISNKIKDNIMEIDIGDFYIYDINKNLIDFTIVFYYYQNLLVYNFIY